MSMSMSDKMWNSVRQNVILEDDEGKKYEGKYRKKLWYATAGGIQKSLKTYETGREILSSGHLSG